MAAALLHELTGDRHVTQSVGTGSQATRRLTTRDVACADVVAVMEAKHRAVIERHWPHHAWKVVVLDVRDDYDPGEGDLRSVLEPKIRDLAERLEDGRLRPANLGAGGVL
jgi:predicted protein tyrosine phosphatase